MAKHTEAKPQETRGENYQNPEKIVARAVAVAAADP